jgi:hypothetical protein
MRLQGSGPYLALLVPDQAIVTDQTRQVLYVVAADGKVFERDVQTGPLTGGLRVIRKGIGAGDTIIIDGVQRARAGQKVTPRQGRIALDTALDQTQAAYVPEEAGSASLVDAGPASATGR